MILDDRIIYIGNKLIDKIANRRQIVYYGNPYAKIGDCVGLWSPDYCTLRIRRDSDDTEQDFASIGNRIDETGIEAFVGSNSAYVTKIYDPRNGNHAIQTDYVSQPRIINAGVWERNDAGRIALYYDGIDDHFDVTDNSGLDITSGGLTLLAQHDPDALNTYILSRNLDITDFQYTLNFRATDGVAIRYGVSIVSNDSVIDLTSKLSISTYDDINSKIYLDGTLKDTSAYSTVLSSRPNMQIGCRSDSVDGTSKAFFYQGHIGDIAVFNKALTQDEVDTLTNQLSIKGWDEEFVIQVDTTKAGSASNTFVLPLDGSSTYDFYINWGDCTDNVEHITTNTDVTHVYASSGVYTISIAGTFPSIYFNNSGDKLKLLDVSNWGSIVWGSMENAFYGCSNLVVSAADVANISNVTNMSSSFRNCELLSSIPSINKWNFSNVTDLNRMFRVFGAVGIYNQDISGIDVSKVSDFSYMFDRQISFNQDLSSWNTQSAVNMEAMFLNASTFDQDISSWDITSLTNAKSMLLSSAFSDANYDLLLVAWEAQTEKPNVTFHAGTAKYSEIGESARQALVSNGWVITDGGFDTLNLLNKNQSDVETDLTGFTTVGAATLTRDITEFYSGVASLKVVTDGVTTREGGYVSFPNGDSGQTYIGQLRIKGPVGLTIETWLFQGAGTNDYRTSITLDGTWQLKTIGPLTIDRDISVILKFTTGLSPIATTFYVDNLMIQEGSTATYWERGG
jgi:surface protein